MSTYRVRGRKRPRVLYHWSPRKNRKRILKHGLLPNQWSVERDWRPPWICLSDTPFMGWCLCLKFKKGTTVDLYEVWTQGIELWRRKDYGREYRIRKPILRTRFRWIGSRVVK